MKAKIEIEMNGPAFSATPATELALILRALAERIESYGDTARMLSDSNGKSVGEFKIIP